MSEKPSRQTVRSIFLRVFGWVTRNYKEQGLLLTRRKKNDDVILSITRWESEIEKNDNFFTTLTKQKRKVAPKENFKFHWGNNRVDDRTETFQQEKGRRFSLLSHDRRWMEFDHWRENENCFSVIAEFFDESRTSRPQKRTQKHNVVKQTELVFSLLFDENEENILIWFFFACWEIGDRSRFICLSQMKKFHRFTNRKTFVYFVLFFPSAST